MTVAQDGKRGEFARRRRSQGFTQESLAVRLGVERSTVFRWETGKSEPQPGVWPELAAALDVTTDRLADLLADGSVESVPDPAAHAPTLDEVDRQDIEQRTVVAAATSVVVPADGVADTVVCWQPGVWTAPPTAVAEDLTREDLMLDRRQIGRALLAVVVSAPLLEPLEHWLSQPSTPVVPGTVRPGVGMPEVQALERTAQAFRTWDDRYGGGLRRKAVVGQLAEVNDLLTESHPVAIRRRLFATLAQLAETAAMMSWDSDEQHLAQRYYGLAIRAAREADDRAFTAVALAGMARQLLSLHRPADALELVRLAQDHAAGHLTPAAEAMLYLREAWAYAALGRPSAFHRTCDKARSVFTDAERSADPYWIRYFDGAELTGTIGGRLLSLARTDAAFAGSAAEHIQQAITLRRPGRRRSAALDQLNMVQARLIQREPDEACRIAHDALAVAEQTTSDRVAKKLTAVYNRTGDFVGVPAVVELRERMRPLVAS